MKKEHSKESEKKPNNHLTRRYFLQISAGGLVLAAGKPVFAALKFIDDVDNPLDFYPARDWEKNLSQSVQT